LKVGERERRVVDGDVDDCLCEGVVREGKEAEDEERPCLLYSCLDVLV
jgi:hypothetical protein